MATDRYFRWAGFLSPFALLVMTTAVSHAQQVFNQPIQQAPDQPGQQGSDQPMISVPPPVVPIPQTTSPGSAPAYPGETVFQAPNNVQRGASGRYMVFVNGGSPYLLQQVQTVEPKAFIQQYQGRQVIQVGTFGDETNARRQIEALRGQGVVAELAAMPTSSYPYLPSNVASSPNAYAQSGAGVPNSYPPSGAVDSNSSYPTSGVMSAPGSYPPSGANSYSPSGGATNSFNSFPPPPPPTGDASTYYPPGGSNITKSSPYLVIVPGSRDELPVLTQRAMGLGIRQDAIQQKDSPLGPHLEIGPFSVYKEAKDVSNYLSGSGLDSRVYFSR
jgi:hypothetical protein